MRRPLIVSLAMAAVGLFSNEFVFTAALADPPSWRAGVAKVDITPTEPVRMAGYGNRDRPSEGVDSPLAARCVALRHASLPAAEDTEHHETLLLVAIDTIGLPGSLSREINQKIAQRFGTPRQNIVLSSTHTHCGPDLISELSNIFSTPLTDHERAAGLRYKARLVDAVLESVAQAIANLQPARIDYELGQVTFAANRRVLTNGRWTGFGVQADGPVDHSLPVLRITGPDGKLRGVIFNYACHGTTLSGDHYRINGDWSGFASEMLESQTPGIVALSTIGCGADANPEPRGALTYAVDHGRVMAAEVSRLVAGPMQPVTELAETRFDHAALTFELPTIEEVRQRIQDSSPQVSRHAARLDEIYRAEGRLPATYPVPIQSWKFGDALTMVFMGGEVVVDYALRLKRELANERLWVTAYAGDVLGYIASQRMRQEGGYEFDRSGVFYGLPGPWAAGTEDHLITSIRQLLEAPRVQSPVSAIDAPATMRLASDDFRLELVAAEPLVQDPINLAFGADGRLWVVEMGDYPLGERGGRIKFLTDTQGDGHYDTATIFLDQIAFPTGVFPWRDGVIIAAAPDILFARDTDGDGRADEIQTLYTGFRLANPQHRVSGFTYGLDHSLHCASGDNLGEITAVRTGQTVNASGHDVQIWPDSGRIATTSGRTQFIRSRDDFGQWFGNDNSRPMWHYPIESSLMARNPAAAQFGNAQQLFSPPVAPPVFAATSTDARFNDLYAAGRFTSACSSIVARCETFDVGANPSIFICEPVHNLVHRSVLEPVGASYRAQRHVDEQATEFLASTDPWFRPVRCEIGPEGGLWIVDMYRETIEHPEWIPQAWQAQLDLYAGKDRGRIYRIVPRQDASPQVFRDFANASPSTLIAGLSSKAGTARDLAMQGLIEAGAARLSATDSAALMAAVNQADSAQGRVAAMATQIALGHRDDTMILNALDDPHPGVVQFAIRVAQDRLSSDQGGDFFKRFYALASHPSPHVALAVALACGNSDSDIAAQTLARVATRADLDRWMAAGVLTSASQHSDTVLRALVAQDHLAQLVTSDEKRQLVAGLIDTAIANQTDILPLLNEVLARSASSNDADFDAHLSLVASVARSLSKIASDRVAAEPWLTGLRSIHARAIEIIGDPAQPPHRRCQAIELLGRGITSASESIDETTLLASLLAPSVPPEVQRQAVNALARIDRSVLVDVALSTWDSTSASIRDQCVSHMLTSAPSISKLLTAIETGTIKVNQLSASARQQLLHSGSRSLMVRAQRLIESNSAVAGSPEKQQLIERYLAQFQPDNDLAEIDAGGLYQKHCGACHQPDDQGRSIGPSLINLSDRRDRTMVEAILDPNRAVEPQYQSYMIRTHDDQLYVGTIESETAATVTLARVDAGRQTIDRSDIAEIKNSGISLMPDGFAELLTPAELQAIIRHLQRGAVPPR